MLFRFDEPVEIWKRKQSWLERYEEVYDSRNIFRKEENTLVEYNNRGYNYNQTRFQQILILLFDIHFSINLALIPKCWG
jgi:hypothetical protein